MKKSWFMSALLVAILSLAGVQTAAAPGAHAAGLTCGRAFVDYNAPGGASVVHSCVGSGTVQYEVTCPTTSNFMFTHVYREPGASIQRPVRCDTFGGAWGNVTWKIV